jgi:hypothetical protein
LSFKRLSAEVCSQAGAANMLISPEKFVLTLGLKLLLHYLAQE